jgi:hypothetical protein
MSWSRPDMSPRPTHQPDLCQSPVPMFNYRILRAWILAAIALWVGLGTSCLAGVVSSTTNQDGYKYITGGSGGASKVGTFQFLDPSTQFSSIRLRTWIELPADAHGPDAPRLVFSKYSADFPEFSLVIGPSISTDLSFESDVPPSFGVDERQSPWVQLTPEAGLDLAWIISQDPLRRVDVWLYSPSTRDFATPDQFTYFDIGPNGEIIIETFVFTATLELESTAVIPEPASLLVFGGLSLTAFVLRRSLRSQTWNQQR